MRGEASSSLASSASTVQPLPTLLTDSYAAFDINPLLHWKIHPYLHCSLALAFTCAGVEQSSSAILMGSTSGMKSWLLCEEWAQQSKVGNLTSKPLPTHWPGSPTNLCTVVSILSTPVSVPRAGQTNTIQPYVPNLGQIQFCQRRVSQNY